MILRHNLRQIAIALLALPASVVVYWIIYQFVMLCYAYGLSELFLAFSYAPPALIWAQVFAVLIMLLVSLSAYRHWQKTGGPRRYQSVFDSKLIEDQDSTMLAALKDPRLPDFRFAYYLSVFFMGAPMLALQAWSRFNNLVPGQPDLEQRLHDTLALLRQAGRWQPITDYPDHKQEILYLARMHQIDFSSYKGTPKIKAEPLTT